MDMYYIGDNNNEFGFKCGDKYDVIPVVRTEFERIGIVVRECEAYRPLAIITFEDYMRDFDYTCNKTDVDWKSIPKRPEEYTSCYCPNCEAEVEFDNEKCDNCGQALDWREYRD